MKNKTKSIFLLTGIIMALIFFIQFKAPITLADSLEKKPNSESSLNTTINSFYLFTITTFDEEQESELEPDINPDPEPNPDPDPEPDPVPEPDPEPEPEKDTKPNPKPEDNHNPGNSSDSKDSKSGNDKGSKSDSNKKPKIKEDKKPSTKPKNNTSTKTNQNNQSGPVISNDFESTTSYNNEDSSEVTPIEIEEDEEDDERVVEDINLDNYSIEELIQMMEGGEVRRKVKDDKYFVILVDGKEKRELTKDEAILLGIIEDDPIDKEDDVELIVEEATGEEIKVELTSEVKGETGKLPVYVSAAGLATVLVGAIMYLIYWRKGTVRN